MYPLHRRRSRLRNGNRKSVNQFENGLICEFENAVFHPQFPNYFIEKISK